MPPNTYRELIPSTLILIPIEDPEDGPHSNSNSDSNPNLNLLGNDNEQQKQYHQQPQPQQRKRKPDLDPEFARRPPIAISFPKPLSSNITMDVYMDPFSPDIYKKVQGSHELSLGRNILTRIWDPKISRRLATVEFKTPRMVGWDRSNSNGNGNGNGNDDGDSSDSIDDGDDDSDDSNSDDDGIGGDGGDSGSGWKSNRHSHRQISKRRVRLRIRVRPEVILKVDQTNPRHKVCLNGEMVVFNEKEIKDGDEISLRGHKYKYEVHILESKSAKNVRRGRSTSADGSAGVGVDVGTGAIAAGLSPSSSSSSSRRDHSIEELHTAGSIPKPRQKGELK